ncbi:MAG: DUF1501 domain-containing protein [Pseudomonadales bacterium]|jgi:uncharacterized protein (DUF1501 family)|nr:DUF1501 domain-containing protein [Pseudomonadales bacterium]
MRIARREFLKGLGAGGLTAALTSGSVAFAAPGAAASRFVFVLLRGGLDGLSAVPAWGDPDFERARAGIALAPPGAPRGALDLDGFFGLHPELPQLHARWQAGELAVLHAHCGPYRERSHFDAQNVLEHGGLQPYGLRTGWLNRAIAELDARDAVEAGARGIAIASAMPLALRGDATVTSWAPSILPSPEADLLDRVERMYGDDVRLASAFAEARMANVVAGDAMGGGRRGDLPVLMGAAARFLSAPSGPRIAMVEAGGWDTHAGQEQPQGALARNLRQLDAGLETLRTGLGEHWADTAVLVLTEFGRTVAMNGSAGTDHGTGGAGFLLGGAVRGGRVVADWPGLGRRDLHEGRDLRATLDTRALIKGALHEHLGLEAPALAAVFPGSEDVRPVTGLVRARS